MDLRRVPFSVLSSPAPSLSSVTANGTAAQSPELEPFGQMGMRQYFGPVMHWLCLIAFAVCIAMWYRSHELSDQLLLRQGEQYISVQSIAGRLKVEATLFDGRRYGNNGWMYRGRPLGRRVFDSWEPSIFKTVGIEFSPRPLDITANGGFWLRIKWYFAAGLCAIIPLWRGVLRWRLRQSEE